MENNSAIFRVLFVCLGNTCRSPLASVALRRALGEEGKYVEIGSAGVMAASDSQATGLAREVAREKGLNLEDHRSRRLDNQLIEAADLLLAMDSNAKEVITQKVPAAAEKTWLITDFARDPATGENIPDPFGGSREAYEECLHRIEEHVTRIAPEIIRRMRARGGDESASHERRGG